MVNHFGQCLRCAGTLAFAKQQIRMYMRVCTTNVNMSTMKIETICGIIVWLTGFCSVSVVRNVVGRWIVVEGS